MSLPQGFERKPYLEPDVRCNDRFEIFAEMDKVRLKVTATESVYDASDSCVVVNDKDDLVAEVCRKIPKFAKFQYAINFPS